MYMELNVMYGHFPTPTKVKVINYLVKFFIITKKKNNSSVDFAFKCVFHVTVQICTPLLYN